ncbi:hypothetical protein V8F20_008678 [Naviculisporaceae sp. PSN 640]
MESTDTSPGAPRSEAITNGVDKVPDVSMITTQTLPLSTGSQAGKEPSQGGGPGQEASDSSAVVDGQETSLGISDDDIRIVQRILRTHLHQRRGIQRTENEQTRFKFREQSIDQMYEIWRRMLADLDRDDKERKSQNTSIPLIKALAEHLGGLEDRVKKVEDENKRFRTGMRKATQNVESDTPVDLTVKFYDSFGHIDKTGKFQDIHDGAEPDTYMCEEDPRYLIRVLYNKIRDRPKHSEDHDEGEPDPEDVDVLTFGVLSKPISSFFESILGMEFENGDLVRFGKPYRPLIRHYHDLRKHLNKLEQKYGSIRDRSHSSTDVSQLHVPQTSTEGVNNRSPSPAPFDHNDSEVKDTFTASYDRPSAIPHFQVLMKFVDKYFGKQIQLYDRIRAGQEDRVAFKDLWMVFDTKDIIYSPVRDIEEKSFRNTLEDTEHRQIRRHTPQAYQVVATTGGMPHMNAVTTRREAAEEAREAGGGAVEGGSKFVKGVRGSYSDLVVHCFYVDFNGIEFGAVREVFVFKPYELKIDVRNLQAFPIRYIPNITHRNLKDRGRHFAGVTKVSHLQYEGLTAGSAREDINSPVVVDMKLAYESEAKGIDVPKFAAQTMLWVADSSDETFDLLAKPTCSNQWCYDKKCLSRIYIQYQMSLRTRSDHEIKPILEQFDHLQGTEINWLESFINVLESQGLIELLPGVVPGFALRNRRWVLLDLAFLDEIKERNEWKNLVLPKGHQRMVQAMVETYTNVRSRGSSKDGNRIGMDLVSGKGEGCIILLHGVPGVGKTSTAECVAAHTNKPLYPITCGDIGVTPEAVESNMERHFKLAHKWGCVLLLDEADVFLAKRDQRDVNRNGLVSVFLRILEYYSGILFLTTNRVGAIDDAFRSRLHLQLYYPKLTKGQTNKIFIKNFEQIEIINQDRVKNNLPPFEYQRHQKKILAWAEKNFNTLSWNGRQIRNGFQTVLALAEFGTRKGSGSKNKAGSGGSAHGPVVNLDLFKTVAEASLQFNRYLKETHGYEEHMIAYQDKVRADPGEMMGTTSGTGSGRKKMDEPMLEDPSDMSTTESSQSEEEEEEDASGDEESAEEEEESSSEEDRRSSKKRGKDKEKGARKSTKTKRSSSKKKGVSGKGTSSGKSGKKSKKEKERERSEDESSGSESE